VWPPSTRTCGTSRAATSPTPRSALLDRYCTEVGRDPAAITRSITLHVSYDQPGATLDEISEALDAGFRHITLGLPAQPYPAGVARWVADQLITKSL
jgi:hypothetical protein